VCADPRTWEINDVQAWVESIGFSEYTAAFLEASIDGRKLLLMTPDKLSSELVLSAAEHVSLIAMEVAELRERRGLMSSSELKAHHAVHPPPATWGVDGVVAWLEDAGLEHYTAIFEKHQVDGAALLRLSTQELASLVSSSSSTLEQNEAAAELLESLVSHQRWRQMSSKTFGTGKDEV